MENRQHNNRMLEEVDLLDFIARLVNITRQGAIDFIRLAFRKKYWILTFFIIGFSVGYYKYSNTKPIYLSEITLRSNTLDSYFIVNSINRLLESGDKNLLTNKFNIDKDHTNSIISVQASCGFDFNNDKTVDDFFEFYNPEDTLVTRLTDLFCVYIRANDTATISMIKTGLLNFFNTDKTINKHNTLRINDIYVKIDLFDKEIKRFENSTPLNLYNSSNNIDSKQTKGLDAPKQLTRSSEIINLYNQKELLQKELVLYSQPISVIQDIKSSKLEKDKKLSTIVSSSFLYMILGLLLSLLWQYRLRIIETIIKDNH